MSNIYYTESTPLCATATVAAATATATLTSSAGRLAFVNGFIISGLGATGATTVAVTLTGVLGGTQTYQFAVPVGATAVASPLIVNFPMPIPASAYNTNIAVSVPTFGAGNTNANATIYGYLK